MTAAAADVAHHVVARRWPPGVAIRAEGVGDVVSAAIRPDCRRLAAARGAKVPCTIAVRPHLGVATYSPSRIGEARRGRTSIAYQRRPEPASTATNPTATNHVSGRPGPSSLPARTAA